MDILGVVNTSDYLSFVLSFRDFSPISVLTCFFLTLMRMTPIVAIAPFLGQKLPGGVKIGLAIALTAIMLPKVMASVGTPAPSFNDSFIIFSLKELLMGFILAFLCSIPFYIAQSSGTLIDFLRGSSALQVTDPLMQTQTSPIGILYNYIFVVLFYEIGGPFIFLEGLLQSYTIVPVDQFMNDAFFHLQQPFWKTGLQLMTQFTALSLQLAAPSLVAILMGEMFLGIANRLAPQVQIAFLGMSIKSLLGIAFLWAGWFFILQQLGKQSTIWMQTLNRLVQTMP